MSDEKAKILKIDDVLKSNLSIPDYQRPYKWDKEKCETLWNDIEDFSRSTEAQNEESYFLGTVVSYNNEDGNPEIIDGQTENDFFHVITESILYKARNNG